MDEPTESDTPSGLRPGSRFGHYWLRRLLGRGGFGEVYEAEDTVMDRAVALKLLAAPYSQNQVFRQRLYREARAAGKLHEPHVVPIHQCGEIDGQVYIDMRLIVGTDLQNVLARDGPLSPPRAVAIVRQIAAALDAAHSAQMVHRDIKPANILLTDDDFACLVDFGLANAATDAKLTSSGTTIGTFAYMAPERFSNTDVSHRADTYALACVLYECLTGSLPYAAGDLPALINAHLTAPIPRPSQHSPQVPAAFDDVIAMGLAKKPRDRYASAGELARAAHQALSEPDQDDADTILADTQAAATGDHPEFKQHPRSHQGARFFAGAEGVVIDAHNLDDWFDVAGNFEDPKFGEGFDSSFRRGRRASPELPILDVVVEPPFLQRHRRIAIRLATAFLFLLVAILLIDVLPAILEHRSSPPSSQPSAPPSPPSQVEVPFTGLNNVEGVAVDSAGNVYVADLNNHRVLKLPAGSNTQVELPFTGLTFPNGVAVDSAGNIYVINGTGIVGTGGQVLKLPAGSNTQVELPFTALNTPIYVAADSGGNVYVTNADMKNTSNNRVLKLPAGSNTQVELPFTGHVGDVAVDTAGNVYVVDFNNRVLKLPAGSDTPVELPFTGLLNPYALAVDTAGNVYVTEADQNNTSNNRVLKLQAGSNTQVELPFTGLTFPNGVAVDSAGNVYVVDSDRVLMLPGA